jgi:hypothetical protein
MGNAFVLSEDEKLHLLNFLKKTRNVDAVTAYCAYIEEKYRLKLVSFPRGKKMSFSMDSLVQELDSEGKLCVEKEIVRRYGRLVADNLTTKLYLCPFCDWAIGDNVDQFAGDKIVEHVAICSKNNEIEGGLKSKRFLISTDPKEIKKRSEDPKAISKKMVFTSNFSSKAFSSKKEVVEDFKKNFVRPITLKEVVYADEDVELDEKLLNFKEEHVTGEVIERFLHSLESLDEFKPYLKKWVE